MSAGTFTLLAILFWSTSPVFSVEPYAPDTAEPGSVEAIRQATTEARFLSPWVAYVPESETVSSPTDYLGHIAGAPGELSNTTQVYGYLRQLAEQSPRVAVDVIGKSEEGRDILLVVIGDEDGIRDRERYRHFTELLSDPRNCDESCLESTLQQARPIYYLNGGLHSTETGSPEMLMELAYRLAVSEQPEIRSIRENVLVLINPISEPDGRDRMVDWFYRYLKGKTDYDHLPYDSPPYWGKYLFHDNNRDTHQRALALTRAVQDTFHAWHPQVVHDLHESIPLLLIWTGTGPYNVHMDPILVGEWHQMAFHEVRTLASLGMPGVWTWGFGEGWGHLYLDSVAVNHNSIGRGYETFGITSAETMDVRLDLEREEFAGRAVTRRDWYRPWPPERTFRWSLRNNTNYMQTGVLSILQYTALHGREMLQDFWRKGRRAIERGTSEPPHAFVIPEKQKDRVRAAAMLNLLRDHRIEVSRATEKFELEGQTMPAGTFLVRMDQPYRGYAWDLLEAQNFPADEATFQAYDDVTWALPHAFGVEVDRVDNAGIRDLAVELVTEPIVYEGSVTGKGSVFLLNDTGQESLLAARHRLKDFDVEVAERPFSHQGLDYSAGSWLLKNSTDLPERLEQTAVELGLDFIAASRTPDVPRHSLDLPRLAVLHTWRDTQAAGWVRLLFDQAGISYDYISDDDVKRGKLEERFDVILYPHTYESLRSIIQGIDPRHGPMPYTKTEEFPSHGTPDSSPDITGGLGFEGLAHLERFVQRGGLLLTLGQASTLPLDGGFVRGVENAGSGELNIPGTEIRARFTRMDHPLTYGYDEVVSVFRSNLPVYKTPEGDDSLAVMRWGTRPDDYGDSQGAQDGPWGSGLQPRGSGGIEDGKSAGVEGDPLEDLPLVVSGGMEGEDDLIGKPAVLDIPVGKGRVVAFNFDPIHRLMSRSDFRFVWNIVLNWNDLPATPSRN